MKLLAKLLLLPLILGFAVAQAGEAEDIKQLRAALINHIPQAADASIKPSPIPGIYEVMAGPQILYTSKDARYILDGDLYDMQGRKNLTELTRGGIRKSAVDALGETNMLVYKPKGDVKHTITVFTDIYCPYCRRLHQEMDQYLAKGVKVRYIFLPFKGQKSYDDSVSVWCAKNPNEAMDKAKAGEEIEAKTCDNPIEKHQQLAGELGVRGTPAIMLENGYLNPGYVPVDKLVQQIEMMGL